MSDIRMVTVKSSNIDSIGHDPARSIMRVAFKNGGTYEHDGVSAQDHAALTSAPSIGRHYAKHFSGKKFRKL